MRILSSHLTPMDRQIQESLNIIEESRKPGNCMNLKSEGAGAKIPGLAMHLPKGLAKDKTLAKETGGATDQETEEIGKEDQTGIGGQKRIRQNRQEDPGKTETGGVDQENHKKLRVNEPQPGNLRYNKPRTFLEVLMANREKVKVPGKQENREGTVQVSTPVRKRIQRLEEKTIARTPKQKRGSGVQGRLTSPPQQEKQVKQSKLTHFFTSKSPKAEEIRGRKDKEVEIPSKKGRETKDQESKHKPGGPSVPPGR